MVAHFLAPLTRVSVLGTTAQIKKELRRGSSQILTVVRNWPPKRICLRWIDKRVCLCSNRTSQGRTTEATVRGRAAGSIPTLMDRTRVVGCHLSERLWMARSLPGHCTHHSLPIEMRDPNHLAQAWLKTQPDITIQASWRLRLINSNQVTQTSYRAMKLAIVAIKTCQVEPLYRLAGLQWAINLINEAVSRHSSTRTILIKWEGAPTRLISHRLQGLSSLNSSKSLQASTRCSPLLQKTRRRRRTWKANTVEAYFITHNTLSTGASMASLITRVGTRRLTSMETISIMWRQLSKHSRPSHRSSRLRRRWSPARSKSTLRSYRTSWKLTRCVSLTISRGMRSHKSTTVKIALKRSCLTD